ncbi:SH3 domain-containing protein [Streptomyces sp. NPDC050564]|uniref:SH3 domain-containing protein n=1 Tax=Streptomyces sp. NPDC050564 TaxID=3365631 RepID=UPI0037A1659D
MFQRSTYARLAIALAAGSLVALAGATPAVADVSLDPGSADSLEWDDGVVSGVDFSGADGDELDPFAGGVDELDIGPTTRGRVDMNGGLALQSSPFDGRLVRVAQNGEFVRIVCKTRGLPVSGDTLWYLIDGNGVWSWGPARFIRTADSPPRC